MKQSDVAIVIRSLGERTENVCYESVHRQVAEGVKIEVVKNEKPFSTALRKSLIKAVDMGAKWSCIVDADLILLSDAIPSLLKHAESSTEDVFRLNPKTYDKFLGFPTFGGPHLYKTKHLENALHHIPSDETSTRPETKMCRAMAQTGLTLLNSNDVVAMHDYEQFYKDIYRKYVFRSVKMYSIARYLINRFYVMSFFDIDFNVALQGVLYGLNTYDGKMYNVNKEYNFDAPVQGKMSIDDISNYIDELNNKHPIIKDSKAKTRLINAEKAGSVRRLSAKLIRMRYAFNSSSDE